MKAKDIKLLFTNSGDVEIHLTLEKSMEVLERVDRARQVLNNNKLLRVDIKEWREKRSLDANGYCWVISQEIAKVIGNTKEFVYKRAIKQVGDFEIVPIKDDAVEKWIRNWESKGLGWQSEVLEKSKLEGYTNIINYYGSSVYNTKEMSVLLEELVFQAKELDIDTMTPEERKRLIDKWEGQK